MQGTENTEKEMVMFTWGFDYADWSFHFLAHEVVKCPSQSVDVTSGKSYS